jgi:hypothetical protein
LTLDKIDNAPHHRVGGRRIVIRYVTAQRREVIER